LKLHPFWDIIVRENDEGGEKMQISSRFTIATHMLIVLALEGKKQKLTSDILAGSVGVNPVIIRKTLSQLKNAGMITVARGTGGIQLS